MCCLGKPNSLHDTADGKEDAEFLNIIRKVRVDPRKKYSDPITESQERGSGSQPFSFFCILCCNLISFFLEWQKPIFCHHFAKVVAVRTAKNMGGTRIRLSRTTGMTDAFVLRWSIPKLPSSRMPSGKWKNKWILINKLYYYPCFVISLDSRIVQKIITGLAETLHTFYGAFYLKYLY